MFHFKSLFLNTLPLTISVAQSTLKWEVVGTKARNFIHHHTQPTCMAIMAHKGLTYTSRIEP